MFELVPIVWYAAQRTSKGLIRMPRQRLAEPLCSALLAIPSPVNRRPPRPVSSARSTKSKMGFFPAL